MKTLLLLGILLVMSTLTFGQSEKCTKYSKDIIAAANLDFALQTPTYTKAIFKSKGNYTLQDIKNVCDSIMKSKPTGWIINSDKNDEKQYLVDNKKFLVTIYWRDEFIYFEY